MLVGSFPVGARGSFSAPITDLTVVTGWPTFTASPTRKSGQILLARPERVWVLFLNHLTLSFHLLSSHCVSGYPNPCLIIAIYFCVQAVSLFPSSLLLPYRLYFDCRHFHYKRSSLSLILEPLSLFVSFFVTDKFHYNPVLHLYKSYRSPEKFTISIVFKERKPETIAFDSIL